ncbi:hypothetical protein LCGC14_1379940 [marine sediment metagenome]|uniref:DUF1508 domain-containing protein n=1 Tax=marine sediment metagenome TaxID=412755 RepID=A0A0F9K3C9_9ZZZZ
MIEKHGGLYYQVFFSPDDGGHYSEVFNGSGQELHVTEVFDTSREATWAAQNWINSKKKGTVVSHGTN